MQICKGTVFGTLSINSYYLLEFKIYMTTLTHTYQYAHPYQELMKLMIVIKVLQAIIVRIIIINDL